MEVGEGPGALGAAETAASFAGLPIAQNLNVFFPFSTFFKNFMNERVETSPNHASLLFLYKQDAKSGLAGGKQATNF